MKTTCDKCLGTGHSNRGLSQYLDCIHCEAATERAKLNAEFPLCAKLYPDSLWGAYNAGRDPLRARIAELEREVAANREKIAAATGNRPIASGQQEMPPDGWALPDVIEALRASGFEVRGEDAAAIVYGTVEAGAVLIDGAIHAFSSQESAPKDCSGDPACCPDNEGYGCHCSSAPVPAALTDDIWSLIDAYANARAEYMYSTERHLAKQQRENVNYAKEELERAFAAAIASQQKGGV